jgi:hypothetical protein
MEHRKQIPSESTSLGCMFNASASSIIVVFLLQGK